jgi:hypothetical protein
MTLSAQDLSFVVALIGCTIAVASFFRAGRKAAVSEGKQQAEVDKLRDGQVRMGAEIADLQKCSHTTDADIREIKTDLKWIRRTLEQLHGFEKDPVK